jgi:hypothetical protein
MIDSAERVQPVAEVSDSRPAFTWVGTVLAAIAVTVGAAAFLYGPSWTMLWVALVLLVLAVVTGSVVRRIGYGQS